MPARGAPKSPARAAITPLRQPSFGVEHVQGYTCIEHVVISGLMECTEAVWPYFRGGSAVFRAWCVAELAGWLADGRGHCQPISSSAARVARANTITRY